MLVYWLDSDHWSHQFRSSLDFKTLRAFFLILFLNLPLNVQQVVLPALILFIPKCNSLPTSGFWLQRLYGQLESLIFNSLCHQNLFYFELTFK